MIKSMSKKQLLIAAVAATVIVVGSVIALLSSSGKKAALNYYDDFKERFMLQDVLSEGEISYSVFSGNLTVKDPEIRLVAARTNGAEQFLRGLSGLFQSGGRDSSNEEGLVGWANYYLSATNGRNPGGVYLKADELKVGHSGDSKSGEIHLKLSGLDMSNPFIAHKGSDVVLVSDVSDEIQPRAEMNASGVVRSSYTWGNNMVARTPVTGAFLVAASGEFGTRVDLDLTLKRSDDGEGSMSFVVTHRNDGSEVGRIVREAEFTALPELDNVQEMLKSVLSGFVISAYSGFTGQAVIAESVSNFSRKSKLANYELTYKGFSPLKDSYKAFQAGNGKATFANFCNEVGLSGWSSDFGSKGKGHSDSECAIAEKLAANGSFNETYTFREDKSLFAALFVSKGFELETE
jgi:hypothetical protein